MELFRPKIIRKRAIYSDLKKPKYTNKNTNSSPTWVLSRGRERLTWGTFERPIEMRKSLKPESELRSLCSIAERITGPTGTNKYGDILMELRRRWKSTDARTTVFLCSGWIDWKWSMISSHEYARPVLRMLQSKIGRTDWKPKCF